MDLVKSLTACAITSCIALTVQTNSGQASAQTLSDNPLPENAQETPLPEAIDPLMLPSISANYSSRHEPSGMEILSGFVEISPRGLRIKDVSQHGAHEMLQNFTEEQAWFIDHERSISHRLPLIEMPELGAASPGLAASFLTPNPCGILRAEEQSPGRWRGRRVAAFNCLDESDTVVSIEFVDKIYNIVVYLRSRDGYIDELSGMTDRHFDESHFLPPEKYREVEKNEFFFGAPELTPYVPSESGNDKG